MKRLTTSKRFILILTYFLINQVAGLGINVLFESGININIDQLVMIQFSTMILIAVIYLIVAWRELVVDLAIAQHTKRFFLTCLKYFGYALLMVYGMSFVLNFIGVSDQPLNQIGVEIMALSNPIIIFMTVVILAPIIEEITFRMAMIILDEPSTFVTLLVSSFVFGFIHISAAITQGQFQEIWYLLIYGGLGAVLGLSYIKTKTIMTPIVVHALYNFMGFLTILLLNG